MTTKKTSAANDGSSDGAHEVAAVAAAPAADPGAPEQPAAGGSYVRQKDGSLKRVAFTDTPPADAGDAAQEA